MNIKTINVVGLGYVGLPTAALLARAGYNVRGVDVNETIVSSLNNGACPLGEKEVAEIVTEALNSGNFEAATTPAPADAFVICVPTPVRDDKTADLSMVRAAIKATAPAVRKGALIILESTSPIGTTRDVIAAALAECGLDPEEDVDICYCPERVFPGATVREILHNDRVVGGLTQRAAERAKALYESFCEGSPITTTAESAEYAKLMENTFRDVNIALANVFARIAEERGVDVQEVITLANRHPRVNVHTPGPGVGGHCIPVDPWFLIEAAPAATSLLLTARKVNDGQAHRLLDRAEAAGLQRGAKIAVLGAAYRGDLDDARESPTEHLIDAFDERGYSYAVHDPYVSDMKRHNGASIRITKDLSAVINKADAAFIMTDHATYRALSSEKLQAMAGHLIVDGRRMLNERSFLEAGFTIVAVGAAQQAPAASVKGERSGGLRVVSSR
ncbi:MAG: nucleotide sugar dehydrogenase [Pseudomonadota bacterium]